MLELKFEISKEEFEESHIRAYFRSDQLRRERRSEMIAGAFFGVVALVFIMRVIVGSWPSWWMYPLAAGFVAVATWDGFRHTAAKRIARRVIKQYRQPFPISAVLQVKEGRLHILSDGMERIFQIEDITWASKDEDYLELHLEDKAHFSIPLRVFEGEDKLSDFQKALGIEAFKDLSQDKSLVPLPRKELVRDGIQRSQLPWYAAAIASTLLGMGTLLVTSMVMHRHAFTNPVTYLALAMIAFGLVLATVLLVRSKRRR